MLLFFCVFLRDLTRTWINPSKLYSEVHHFFFKCTYEGRDEILGHKLSTCFTYKICFPGYQVKAFLLEGTHCLAWASLRWYIAPYRSIGHRHKNLIWTMEEPFPQWIEGQLSFLPREKFSVARKLKLLKLLKDKQLVLTLFLPPTEQNTYLSLDAGVPLSPHMEP